MPKSKAARIFDEYKELERFLKLEEVPLKLVNIEMTITERIKWVIGRKRGVEFTIGELMKERVEDYELRNKKMKEGVSSTTGGEEVKQVGVKEEKKELTEEEIEKLPIIQRPDKKPEEKVEFLFKEIMNNLEFPQQRGFDYINIIFGVFMADDGNLFLVMAKENYYKHGVKEVSFNIGSFLTFWKLDKIAEMFRHTVIKKDDFSSLEGMWFDKEGGDIKMIISCFTNPDQNDPQDLGEEDDYGTTKFI